MYPGYFMTSIPMSIPIASENFHIHIWNLHPILHHLPHRWHKCVMRVPTGPFKGGKDSSIIISVVLMEEAAANARRHNGRWSRSWSRSSIQSFYFRRRLEKWKENVESFYTLTPLALFHRKVNPDPFTNDIERRRSLLHLRTETETQTKRGRFLPGVKLELLLLARKLLWRPTLPPLMLIF